jgi:uncharacterized protein YdhG (YjbR/CyaY superfamily)
MQTRKAATIDEYLAPLPADKRAALQWLRRHIKAAAPAAEECISYGIPAFRLDGKLLVHFGAAAKHCAFYPGAVIESFKDELAGYDTSKGTIRFQPGQPPPAGLVRTLVQAQMSRRAAPRGRSVRPVLVGARVFRRLALGLKGVVEGAHMGHPDFRVHGRIFATLSADGRSGMVRLTAEQQRDATREHPAAFEPARGAWGRQGCTMVQLDAVDAETLGEALTLARQGAERRSARRARLPRASPSRRGSA